MDHVLEEVNVEKASLFAWSRGGNVTGVYTSLDPPKVESLVLLASEFEFAGNPQPYALIVDDRTQSFRSWDNQLSKPYPRACPGGSTSLRWKGPHATVHDAAAQWIRFQTFDGEVNGRFTVDGDGDLYSSQ